MKSYRYLVSIAFLLSACGSGSKDSGGSSRANTNDITIQAGTLCSEINQVFDRALDLAG